MPTNLKFMGKWRCATPLNGGGSYKFFDLDSDFADFVNLATLVKTDKFALPKRTSISCVAICGMPLVGVLIGR